MRVAAVQLTLTPTRPATWLPPRLVRAPRPTAPSWSRAREVNLLAACEDLAAGAEPLDGPRLTAAAAGRGARIHLLAGSIPERR